MMSQEAPMRPASKSVAAHANYDCLESDLRNVAESATFQTQNFGLGKAPNNFYVGIQPSESCRIKFSIGIFPIERCQNFKTMKTNINAVNKVIK